MKLILKSGSYYFNGPVVLTRGVATEIADELVTEKELVHLRKAVESGSIELLEGSLKEVATQVAEEAPVAPEAPAEAVEVVVEDPKEVEVVQEEIKPAVKPVAKKPVQTPKPKV